MNFLTAVSRQMTRFTALIIVLASIVAFIEPATFSWVKGDTQVVVLGIIMLGMGNKGASWTSKENIDALQRLRAPGQGIRKAVRDDHAPAARRCLGGVEGIPGVAQIGLEPGVQIHRFQIMQPAHDHARRNVERAA